MRLEALSTLMLPAETAARLGCGDSLTLRRGWPRSADHLLLEYTDDAGRIAAGQWFRDPECLDAVERETPTTRGGVTGVVSAPVGAVILQVAGADRRLKGLARILRAAGSSLISHRPERRAVVRSTANGDLRYAKIVRRSRLGALLTAHEYVAQLDGRPFAVPEILETDARRGVIWLASLRGVCLHDDPRDAETAAAVGRSLRWLHESPIPSASAMHDAQAEVELLTTRLQWLEHYAPELAERARVAAPAVLARLGGDAAATPGGVNSGGAGGAKMGLLHRDFYDKQIFVDDEGRVALLDFDTLTRGETALDVANMLAHVELRTMQGRLDDSCAHAVAGGFMAGYDAEVAVRDRIAVYVDAARLRLACLYAYRPGASALSVALMERIGG